MANTKTRIPFSETAQQRAALLDAIRESGDMSGGLIPVLQKAQDIYGYLPIEVQKTIAEGLNIPLEEVYGVVSFYAQFSLNPKGKYRVSMCLGTACYVKGAQEIYDRLIQRLGVQNGECTPDGKFSLEACRCIGACGLAPVMMINDNVYGRLVPDDIDKILSEYRDK